MAGKQRFSPVARLLAAMLFSGAACGGGEDSANPQAPTTPRPSERELTGLETVAERTTIRIGERSDLLMVYGRYDDGTTGTVAASWASSDTAVVEVADGGVLFGVGAGVAGVTATFDNFSHSLDIEVREPNPRSLRDDPDDIPGPQIHVVYAVPSDAEDGNLDRYGGIARSFQAIQHWLTARIGYRLRLDTHGGALDVTFVGLSFTSEEGAGKGDALIGDLERAVTDTLGLAQDNLPDKLYAVYYAGQSAGVCGSAQPGGQMAAVYVHAEGCSAVAVGGDPETLSTYEAAMLHQLLHAFGAVPPCAPGRVDGPHVGDSPEDLLYSGIESALRSEELTIDFGRDDYFGHENTECLDISSGRFWEPVDSRAPFTPDDELPRARIPFEDWPLRCGLHETPPEPPTPPPTPEEPVVKPPRPSSLGGDSSGARSRLAPTGRTGRAPPGELGLATLGAHLGFTTGC